MWKTIILFEIKQFDVLCSHMNITFTLRSSLAHPPTQFMEFKLKMGHSETEITLQKLFSNT